MLDNILKTNRMDIYVDESRNEILIREKWKYNWRHPSILPSAKAPWTYMEKKAFHHKADNLIWKYWSNKFTIRVDGDSEFVIRNKGKDFTVDFDIEWVLSDEHWVVDVIKLADGETMEHPSWVDWNKRKIQLLYRDVDPSFCVREGQIYNHSTVAHEWGHAIGNVPNFKGMHWDEYRDGSEKRGVSKYSYDRKSMMNVGTEVRIRHLDYLCSVLRIKYVNTSFTLKW